ncbi:MAG: glycogen synthase GlgA [Armatimonadetes bacterium]|nr:glycogen synthase GlgA [Armatimonadota bacterium]
MPHKLKILVVSAEVAPFAKVGGLADVAGALPKALKAMGHDVRVAMPGYKMIEANPAYDVKDAVKSLKVPLGDKTIKCSIKQTKIGKNIPVYLVSAPYFAKSVDSKTVYVQGSEPYAFFARAVLEMLRAMKPTWTPDVIHCNDWHTGLLPVYKSVLYADDPILGDAACVFTIHNLAYQGEFDFSILAEYGLPELLYTMDKLECYGKVNFLKAGIVFSDLVSTVSPTYSCEIRTCDYGCRLEGLLCYMERLGRLRGILNGIDYEEFDPATDNRIKHNFSLEDMRGKAKNKRDLQSQMGLPTDAKAPVIGLVSRLADQKGLDLIKAAMSKMMKLGVQFVVLGTGDQVYEKFFASLESKHPDQVKANIGFDVNLAQLIYAGSDMFLMPSRFEPCGLGQLIALRYGTIPIVRATGGLADTIVDYSRDNPKSNGFAFTEYSPSALLSAVKRAVETYQNRAEWESLVRTALASDFSWRSSAGCYVEFYQDAAAQRRLPAPAFANAA